MYQNLDVLEHVVTVKMYTNNLQSIMKSIQKLHPNILKITGKSETNNFKNIDFNNPQHGE